MAIYRLEPTRDTLHGHFSRDLTPLLTIAPGDSIHYRTLDAGWHLFDQRHPFEQAPSFPSAMATPSKGMVKRRAPRWNIRWKTLPHDEKDGGR